MLHDPVRQELAYASGTYDAARWQIPAVPLRVFRYPDDRLVALAVNSKTFPVDLTLTIRGLAGAARLFAGEGEGALAVKDGAFTDSLEPHAVRAYALKASGDPAAALAVSIVTQEHPDKAPASLSNERWLATVRAGKNLILNPSFEMQKIPGRPDGYMPYKVVRLRATREAPADYALDKDNPKFGTVSLRLSHPAGYRWAGIFGLSLAPKERGRPHVFSFYARAQAAGTRLWVGLPAAAGWHERTITLTAEWARYSMPCPSPGGPVLLQASGKGDQAETIWLDGLQLEAGETPTEFSEP